MSTRLRPGGETRASVRLALLVKGGDLNAARSLADELLRRERDRLAVLSNEREARTAGPSVRISSRALG